MEIGVLFLHYGVNNWKTQNPTFNLQIDGVAITNITKSRIQG
jgi:hypothetical protein